MKNFRGKVVVITGAGSGIGRATAMAFAQEGARLHITDIDEARISAVADEITSMGAEATPYTVDSADRKAMEEFAEAVYAAAGRVDILHNNAGIALGSTIDQTSLEEWEKIINVNLWGVIYGIHFFLPRMIDQGGGHIVNTASAAGLAGFPTLGPYTATKFAVVGISEVMSMELARYGIHTTALCPGIIATNIVRDSKVAVPDKDGQNIKDKAVAFYAERGAPPERVARDVLKAVRRKTPLMPSPYHVYPIWIIKRISARLYQALVRLGLKVVGI
jgi:NADP-dependent 3-hydroxy acid dehydrogenase YdfG